jgi:hypothetical protein
MCTNLTFHFSWVMNLKELPILGDFPLYRIYQRQWTVSNIIFIYLADVFNYLY